MTWEGMWVIVPPFACDAIVCPRRPPQLAVLTGDVFPNDDAGASRATHAAWVISASLAVAWPLEWSVGAALRGNLAAELAVRSVTFVLVSCGAEQHSTITRCDMHGAGDSSGACGTQQRCRGRQLQSCSFPCSCN